MKCYVHQDLDAVGVCSVCGQGVCGTCAVMIGGKLYCKEDADKVFGSTQTPQDNQGMVSASRRSTAITVAFIIFYIIGILGIIGGIGIIVLGILIGALSGISDLLAGSPIGFLGVISAAVTGWGVLFLVVSSLYILAGAWLRRSLKRGGLMGIAILITSIVAAIVALPVPVIGGPLSAVSVGVDTLILILIAAGWRSLH